ncbi:carbohydrate ABC transporter permease [Streptomyces sioyaensis]|uniref:Carbohydrate ABC transporter permease n=1 Tax=Streptomyces sioyaensis TaxID=67364 RepID=A0A4Q1R568_9ACTN|nr:carbohydrate ABC transporter permease [Streptomyces sioyaensis]MBM4790766.1 carbohydrate ABC transporter permease [Streptomyces sioyaensis]RXS67819.1 carbohydrate ABC transporter permease [Streptomyces sioyaensis]
MTPPTHRRSRRHRLGRSAWTTGAWLAAIVFFFPVLWMVLTAFKPESAAYTRTPQLVFSPTLTQFRAVFSSGIGPYLANSALASVISTVLALLLAAPAAYALSVRPVKKWRNALFFFISTKMLPVVAAIIPIYLAVRDLGALDGIGTLIILYAAMNLPIAVWMLRSFFLEVPREVLEAARVDGATTRQELTAVLLPMVLPGIAATSLICLIFSWNEFFLALNLTSFRAATIPVFLVGFITSEGLYWAKLSAAATLACLPVLLAGWTAQRQLVRGLSMGAVK